MVFVPCLKGKSHGHQEWTEPEALSKGGTFIGRHICVPMEGVAVQAGYMLSDAVAFNLTYGYAWRSDGSLGTGGAGDIGINPLDHYQIFQADLNVKF